uniref:NADH dehydrogenase subunit 4 n=1 Tax=Platystethus arenarius TaxID=347436 RepID=UPI002A82F55A|nr:NADH dehydrogenase subunit 4 [Platystethus arenarius]WON66116.1 NADH dehydrogenase subunit 4 [Platystethus arenarius]
MMKMIMMVIFMIPLIFYSFWLNLFVYFIVMMFFMVSFNWVNFYSFITFFYSIDLMSYLLILLSVWICALMIQASYKLKSSCNFSLFLFMINILLLVLILTFSSINLFMFYLFFEMSLIPTLMLILGWGYQPERIQAGLYLLFYTLLASLPMLVGIFYIYLKMSSLNFYLISMMSNSSFYLYLSFNIVFLVKFPMYLFHLWLPKAHVEAPISGSMILAGVMLKLGGYGMIRLMSLFQFIGVSINHFFMMISMVGGCLISLICLRQSDMKSLIAYSSVAHMSLVIGGILTMNYWGLIGALIMMLAHGLCSSGMFCLANISYERVLSRSLFLNKGMINLMPSMSLWWFLLSSSNMAAPPSLNLMGEIMLLGSMIMWSKILMVMLMFMSFFGAGYSLYLYSYSQHGNYYSGLYSFSLGSIREFLLLLLHWLPLNLFILKSDLFIWI